MMLKYSLALSGALGHADLHFMTHKSISQGWAMSDQLSAYVVSIILKVEKHSLKVS